VRKLIATVFNYSLDGLLADEDTAPGGIGAGWAWSHTGGKQELCGIGVWARSGTCWPSRSEIT
jgi:hypothetical protein